MASLLCTIISLYLMAIFGYVILSWFPITPGGAMASVRSVLSTVCDPVLRPVRRAIRPVQLGSSAIDISPLAVMFGGVLLQRLICG